MKTCTNCKKVKLLCKFSKKKASIDGYANKCKDCHNDYVRNIWYPNNRKKQISSSVCYKQNNKIRVLATKYKIKEDDLKEMFRDTQCKICGSKIGLVVDHCHTTNKVRGILCQKCNSGLGFFKDNIDSLNNAIKYLVS